MHVKWSEERVCAEIRARHQAGESLSYSGVAAERLPLLRAGVRLFGGWGAAVGAAGLDYGQVRRHQSWDRERVVARIRELHDGGVDLSWRHVSRHADPALAAAALRGHFASWDEALAAAGLDYGAVRRYRAWDEARVLDMVRALHRRGQALSVGDVEREDAALLAAARRRFASWDETLRAAGLDLPMPR